MAKIRDGSIIHLSRELSYDGYYSSIHDLACSDNTLSASSVGMESISGFVRLSSGGVPKKAGSEFSSRK